MKITDSLFEEVYNDKLLEELRKSFGPFHQRHVDQLISSKAMLQMVKKMREKPRRGEVVMVVPNKQGHLWLHTKAFYPKGIYRLMTGGIDGGETPHKALKREVKEETGFKVKIDRCLAVVTYTLSDGVNTVPFASYAFLTTPTKGTPQPIDPNEAITAFQAVPAEALFATAQQLRSIEGDFADWGLFRAIAHEVVGEVLAENSNEKS